MGLLSALSNAVSGLNVNQQQLTTLSQNISNANTAGYSREIVNQQADFIKGQAAGVSVSNISRSVSDTLNAQVRTQSSINSSASTLTSYYSQIQNLLGQPGGSNSLDQTISSFFVATQTLANSPSASAYTNVVNNASQVAGQISGLANSLQNLRLQADGDIANAVSAVNSDLQNLAKTNLAIEQAAATGQNTAGLLDQRDAAVNDIAQYLDVKPVYQSDGAVTLNTSAGVTLLTTTTSSQLSYIPASSANTFISNQGLSPLNVTIVDANGNALGQPVALITGGKSASVTTTLVGGKLQGLESMRDSIIPNILSQLDQLASTLRDKFNAINNAGASYPPPNSYTGTTLVAGSTDSLYSGSVRIAALTSTGAPAASPYVDEPNGIQPLTLNLASLNGGQGASVDDIIKTVNQYYGPPQNKVELGNINNIQLGLVSNNLPASDGTLSMDFNLNNISASNANFFVSGVTVLDNNGNTVASSAGGTVATTQHAINVASYQMTAGQDTVTVTTSAASNLKDGDVIYLNAPSGTVNGVGGLSLGGYFTISNVDGNSFNINVQGAGSTAVTGTSSPSGVTGYASYDTVAAGETTRTGANGILTATLPSGALVSPYYTVKADVATVDSNGNVVTSTISYRVPNNVNNVANNLIGATSQAGNAKIVTPSSGRPILTASLVDANGNPLPTTNGLYGNQQGYLKITANSSTNAVAIDEMNSKQLGIVNGPANQLTGQGFSQYFGLNNFFNPPAPSANGDTVTNSAINLAVQSRITANPSLVSTGKLVAGNQPSAGSSTPPNYTYQVNSGDNSVSQQFAALSTNLTSFASAGGLAASNTTFSQYAGQIIAVTSTNSNNATAAQTNSQALLDGFTKSAQAVSGVNIDQELANTVIYQNAYSASARIITVVGNLFDSLLQSVQ